MARPQKPLDFSLYAQAQLAKYLRDIHARTGLSFAELAQRTVSSPATLKRAASGKGVPRRTVVEDYVQACTTPGHDRDLCTDVAVRLWKRARHDEERPGRAYDEPRPDYVRDFRDLSGALRDLHAYAGFPSAAEMERRAGGFNALPHSTAHRIIRARAVPRTEHQLLGFLLACEAPEERRHLWVEALYKCLAGPDESPPAPRHRELQPAAALATSV
ncbi:helix-turn-helix transcriptional regulator [Streptomyces pactum]|uniref:Transcriptional regulator n=1 Tax=Streptomyces pactum TaxID=68249 RepID=A0A1S6JIU9_9ACTN|nr:helix-turn-helix transcriptional regulator [Streptomyces pactum]AQS65604.1 transcriptional regulator [Streptomyces pactum]AQS71649.1 transcriptional regulator [Streptomyces pactum]